MPRIDAPTVAEHRTRQRAAIVTAARNALSRDGVSAVTPGLVAKSAGLARTSVYQYFPSTQALLAAAIDDVFAVAASRIDRTLSAQSNPMERVRAYVKVALRAAAGGYGPFHGIAIAELPGPARQRIQELRGELERPLVAALEELGVPSPAVTAAIVGGVVGAGINLILNGIPANEVTASCCSMIDEGIRGSV